MTSKLPGKFEGRKAKIIAIVSGVLVAATPGVYGAFQSAKEEWKQKLAVETATRDKQEYDLQANVKAHESAIQALEKSCVTHKELLSIVLKLQRQSPGWRRRPASVRASDPAPTPGTLEDRVVKLRAKVKIEKAAVKQYKLNKIKKPMLKPADSVRKQIIQQIRFKN